MFSKKKKTRVGSRGRKQFGHDMSTTRAMTDPWLQRAQDGPAAGLPGTLTSAAAATHAYTLHLEAEQKKQKKKTKKKKKKNKKKKKRKVGVELVEQNLNRPTTHDRGAAAWPAMAAQRGACGRGCACAWGAGAA